MRSIKFMLLPIIALLLFSCSEDDVTGEGTKTQIKNWASTDVINAIEGLGFIIHEGTTPPNIEGKYSLNPRILQNTNVPNDFSIGSTFWELQFELTQQNNSQLTIDFDGEEFNNGVSSGESISVNNPDDNSYIIGSGDNFTAFFKVNETKDGQTATLLYAISGKKTANGFEAFQQGLMMLDENGTPGSLFIRNNTGRIFSDKDGIVSPI